MFPDLQLFYSPVSQLAIIKGKKTLALLVLIAPRYLKAELFQNRTNTESYFIQKLEHRNVLPFL